MEKKIPTKVTIIDNGPMLIRGDYELIGRDGAKIELTPDQKSNGIAICRCGKSKNLPFCDGSHAK